MDYEDEEKDPFSFFFEVTPIDELDADYDDDDQPKFDECDFCNSTPKKNATHYIFSPDMTGMIYVCDDAECRRKAIQPVLDKLNEFSGYFKVDDDDD